MTDSSRNRTFRFCLDLGLTVFFFVSLWLPSLDSLLHLDPLPPPQENRNPAPWPHLEWSRESIEDFPKAFEEFFNDHFGFRNTLIRRHNQFKYAVLHVSPNEDKVLVGKKGWLFESDKELKNLIRHQACWDKQTLARYRKKIEKIHSWLKEKGIRYLVVYVPEAWSVYPEYLPDAYHQVGEESCSDQVVRHLRAQCDVPLIDLKPVLLAEKKKNLIYRPLDPHWNEEGAYVAYLEIVRELKKWFPSLKPLEEDRLKRREYEAPGGYLNRALSLPYDLLEVYHRVEVATPTARQVEHPYDEIWARSQGLYRPPEIEVYEQNPQSEEIPSLVFFHDSFGNALVPFLKEHFKRTVSVRWPPFSHDIVEREKPDLVISEFAERNVTLKRVSYW